MLFMEAVADLLRRFPDAPLGETAKRGPYFDRAVGLTDYEQTADGWYLGHGVNGKEMWVYYSEAKNRICCGDKVD